MTSRLPHLAQRLFNVPLAIRPEKAEVVMVALGDRFGVTHLFNGNRNVPMAYFDDDAWGSSGPETAYDIVEGVGVIAVQGTLVAKLGCVRPYSGLTGYDGIRTALNAALADTNVKAIVLDVDSPGGEVAGVFDLSDAIYAARGTKPMVAILNEAAYSAAYAIASACDQVIVPRTGGTGSVGVIVLHADLSQALSKAGIAVTLIRYGDHKYEGNSYEPLPPDALARLQADVNVMGEMFVMTVARNRNMTLDAVRETQAGCFLGAEGVSVGFADAVMAPDAAFQALISSL